MFGIDPRQLAAALELLGQLVAELRRLNDHLEALRPVLEQRPRDDR